MDKSTIFSILRIEPTKSEDEIKHAYRSLLVEVNPEDNPEGFKQLRQAYEEAIVYANAEEEEKKQPETPVEIWMERVEQVYASLSNRLQEEKWKELLEDEVCLSLDTSMEAKYAILSFLTNHFRIKSNIWRLLDQTFLLHEDIQDLYEHYPKGFIDYMIQQCSNTDDFSYELFEGADNADYDAFLYHYIELSYYNDEVNWEEGAKKIEILENMPIEHPLYQLEKARYLQGVNQAEEAVSIVRSLLEEHGEDLRIIALGAEVLWKNEDYKEAVVYFEKAIEQYPNHYLANKRLGHYHLVQKEYKKAKKHIEAAIAMLGNGQEPELVEDMKAINECLIEEYETTEKKDELDFKQHLSVGWCYLQNYLAERGIAQLEKQNPPKEHEAEYYSLLSRLYQMAEQYDKSIEHAKHWKSCIEQETPETEEEKKNIPIRLGAASEVIAQGYIGKAKEDSTFYKDALEEMNHAIDYDPEDNSYLEEKAKICMKMEDYHQVIDICDKMKERDPEYFWTYIFYQRAYSELGDAQEVIDNFYRAKNIYAGYPNMYELAAEVFLDYKQFEDAERILEQAKEVGVESNRLLLYRAKINRQKAETKKEKKEILRYCKQVRKEMIQKQADNSMLAEITLEITRCCRDLNEQDGALHYINEAIAYEEQQEYDWVKANILLDKERYSEALEYYLKCEKDHEENEVVLEQIAYCYKMAEGDRNALDDYTKAKEYYDRVLQINPENPRANGVLVDIYKWFYKRRWEQEMYEKAIMHADRQIELDKGEDPYYYNKRGLLHMEASVWDLSLKDFEKAIELDETVIHPYINIGCIYKYIGQYEKALEFYRKAEARMKEGESKKVYGNIGDCYERMGEQEKALEAYLKNREMFPKDKSIAEDLYDMYTELLRYEDAYALLEDAYEAESSEYYREKGFLFVQMNQMEKAMECFEKSIVAEEEPHESLEYYGNFCLWVQWDLEKALELYQKAWDCTEQETSDYRDACYDLMKCYYYRGEIEQVKKYFNYVMEDYKRTYGGVEQYLRPNPYLLARLYDLVCGHIYIGDIEQAEKYLEQMKTGQKCRNCTLSCCKEYYLGKGMIYEQKGEKEKALACYKKVSEMSPNLWMSKKKIEQLEAETC